MNNSNDNELELKDVVKESRKILRTLDRHLSEECPHCKELFKEIFEFE